MARQGLATAFGIEIREMRHALGLSQEELAHRSGVHRNYVGMIERAEQSPSLAVIEGLARGLHIKPSDLIARAEGRSRWQL